MEVNIKQLISFFIKHIWKIMIATIVCGILGFVTSSFIMTEKYESSSLMYISSNKNSSSSEDLTYSEYNLNIKLVNSYSELCKTDRVLNKVLNENKINITLGELSKMISINSVNNTEIIQIVVKNEDPEVATMIANAVAVVFTREIPSIIKMDNVQIIDYATVPTAPVEPNVMMNTLIAMLVGMFISILVLFLMEHLDVSIKEREQLEGILEAPVFGVIPRINNESYGKKTNKNKASSSAIREAFVRLASNMSFLSVDNPKSVCIVVTSSIMGEGKSTIVSNLSIALAKSQKKVLLIDADMRKPMVHKLFKLTNRAGLSSALSSSEQWKNYVLTTQFKNLDVIVAGIQPPNPTMLLSTNKMNQIIKEAMKIYDFILIDTPPILVVSDLLSLCSYVDHILLVARYKQVSIHEIHKVKDDLAQIKVPLTGAILNDYPFDSDNIYSNYGYYENNEHEIESMPDIKNILKV